MRQQRRINRSMASESVQDTKEKIETHEYKDSISVRFPVFDLLLVFFRRHLQIHRENGSGPVDKIRRFPWCLIRHRLGRILAVIYGEVEDIRVVNRKRVPGPVSASVVLKFSG